MPRHIAEMIRLKGGNEYREGSKGGDVRSYNPKARSDEYIRSYLRRKFQNK